MPVQSTIPILGAPNYQGWFSMLDNGSDQEKNRTFERDIIPYISDYAEGTSFNAVLEEHQWLREFIDPESSYAATLREFEHRPNEATITMADFVKHLAGTVITVAWQENMKTFVQNAEANPSGGRLMNDGEVTECREAFEKALPKLADHPLWRVLCARVRAFSLRIGCPTAAAEPLDCITCMRIHMNARVSRIGEATSRNQRRPLVKQNWGACLSTLEGHGDGVRSVVFSHDSKLVASASSDKTVRIWSVETGECEQVLEGHNDCISSVVFSHDSKLVASASDRMVRIWSVETGECQQVLEGYGGGVRSVVFSHDSKLVASTSNDKTVRIWSVETGKCEKVLEGHSRSVLSVVFSYDSKLIASASLDKTVRIWMVETGKCEKVLEDHSDWVNSVVFSHNSKLIASAALDKTVRIWIVETGKCEKVLEGHSSSVISVVFSYDSKLMASASNDKTVRIWSVETGKCEQVLDGHIDCITSVVFSHDSKLVASASHKMVWIWSVETGECQQILEGHSSWVISAVFSHDSKLIASGSVDKTVRIWRMEAGKCEQVLEGHRDSVNLGYTALHAVAGGGHSESETRSNDDHGNHEDDELDYQDWEDEVNVSHPVVMTGLPSTLPELVDTIFHTISPISEPAVPLGKTRIRWQCRCGENLFDDFVEVKPGSLMALQARLREMNGTHDSNQGT